MAALLHAAQPAIPSNCYGVGRTWTSAPLRDPFRSLTWSGGGAALTTRAHEATAAFEVSVARHACIFTFWLEAEESEIKVDGKRMTAGKYSGPIIAVLPSRTVYWGLGTRSTFEYLAIFFEPAALQAAAHPTRSGSLLRPDFGAGDPGLWHIGQALRQECIEGGATGQLYAETLSHALAARLLRVQGAPAPAAPRTALAPWRVRRIIEHLGDHVAEPVSLADLAAIAELSPSHTARAFRVATGETPHRYHLRLRIARAEAMLRDRALPLADIALACGFPDQSHFTTMFRRMTGMTPGRWREEALR